MWFLIMAHEKGSGPKGKLTGFTECLEDYGLHMFSKALWGQYNIYQFPK